MTSNSPISRLDTLNPTPFARIPSSGPYQGGDGRLQAERSEV
jgi:hypothetical protein